MASTEAETSVGSPPRTDRRRKPLPRGKHPEAKPEWSIIGLVVSIHALGVVAIAYMATVHFSWWNVALGVVWFLFCGFSITAGYHRLFAHRAYEASALVRAFYLFFGAASAQNSALKWCDDHRLHHAKTDEPEDPYCIRRGFWWAHVGWVLNRLESRQPKRVRDLGADRLVLFQDRHYAVLAILGGAVLPGLLGFAWGDPLGALLVAGFLRLVFQWHATFAINSFAHMVGGQPYGSRTSACDSAFVAAFTLGEGYHNYHHRFPSDYRNGPRKRDLDPTKWLIWSLSKLGAARGLRRTAPDAIRAARVPVATRRWRE